MPDIRVIETVHTATPAPAVSLVERGVRVVVTDHTAGAVISSYCLSIGPRGEAGLRGTGGAWLVGETYAAGDVVSEGSAVYVALASTTGEQPSTHPAAWSVIDVTLPDVGAAGTSSGVVTSITTDGKGRVTARSSAAIGSTAGTIAAGDDTRFADARTPTDGSVTNAKVASDAAVAVSKLAASGTADDILATRAGVPVWISAATLGLILAGDSRLSDTRTPTDNSVTTAKLVDAAVTSAKLADGAVTSSKLPVVGPGAGTIGASGSCVQSVTLDAQGRVTAATAASLPTALPPTAGSVVDASVSSTASIAVSKLALGAVNTVLKGGASANSFAQIVDADISSSAAIAGSKISPVFGAQNITGSAKITVCAAGGVNNATNGAIVGGGGSPTLSGAATSSGILAGNGASVSGAYAAACGGSNLTVSGGYGFAGGGVTNVAGADRSACVGGTSGTIASGCDNSTTSGGLTNSIAKGLGHHIAGSTLCTIGNASLAAGNYSAIIASTSCLIGTVTAGGTNCGIFASNGSSIQSACTNNAIVGGATLVMGSGGTATGNSVMLGGRQCTNNSTEAGTLAGLLNVINGPGGNFAVILGGRDGTVAGVNDVACTIVGGRENTVANNCEAACILGSLGATTSMIAQIVHAGGYTTTKGERQASEVILRCDTAGAQTGSLLGGVLGGAPTQPLLTAAARSYTVHILVNVHKTVATAADIAVCAGWEIKAVVYNQSGTVSVQPGYTVTQLQTTLPTGLVGATVTLSGSGNNLVVTGDIGSGNTISTKWAARANWIENG